MQKQDYRHLMTALCSAVGLDSTTEAIGSQHLVINGTTVGVIFDEAISPTRLFIYIDLGPMPDAHAAELHRSMLAHNVQADGSATGHFGIHPKTGNPVFHVRMHFSPDLGGDELARFLHHQVRRLQGWVERYATAAAAPAVDRTVIPTVRASTAARLSLHRQTRVDW